MLEKSMFTKKHYVFLARFLRDAREIDGEGRR